MESFFAVLINDAFNGSLLLYIVFRLWQLLLAIKKKNLTLLNKYISFFCSRTSNSLLWLECKCFCCACFLLQFLSFFPFIKSHSGGSPAVFYAKKNVNVLNMHSSNWVTVARIMICNFLTESILWSSGLLITWFHSPITVVSFILA